MHAFLKVCGITRVEDARHAVAHGATAIGFVFWPKSPRAVTAAQAADIAAALPPTVVTVGVFVNEPIAQLRATAERAGVRAVQLHGDEPPGYAAGLEWPLLRSVTLESSRAASAAWSDDALLLLDAADPVRRGGTGQRVDWQQAAALARRRRLILAGGLTPANVAEAIAAVRPYGVDVSSGVEEAPGVKDLDKVTQFLTNARAAFERA